MEAMKRIVSPGDILPAKEAIAMVPHMDLKSPIMIPEIPKEAFREHIDPDMQAFYQAEIMRLKKEKDAYILAHNYMPDTVQDVADYVADSIKLAQRGRDVSAKFLVEPSVLFMNQILAALKRPEQVVLAPSLDALCSLAAHAKLEKVLEWKASHPEGIVVSYVNTYIEIKAESDYCCGSANAEKVVKHVLMHHASVPILFLPDVYLGLWASTILEEQGESIDRLYLMMGACHVHDMIRPVHVELARAEHPDAVVTYHPECGCTSACMTEVREGRIARERMQARSTQGMVDFARTTTAQKIIMATEVGNMHPIRKAVPGKIIIPANPDAMCAFMKQNTLKNLYEALRDEKHVVTVHPDLAERARLPIERMLDIV